MKKLISKNDLGTCFVMTRRPMSMLAILFFITGCATDESMYSNSPQASGAQISKPGKADQTEALLLFTWF